MEYASKVVTKAQFNAPIAVKIQVHGSVLGLVLGCIDESRSAVTFFDSICDIHLLINSATRIGEVIPDLNERLIIIPNLVGLGFYYFLRDQREVGAQAKACGYR